MNDPTFSLPDNAAAPYDTKKVAPIVRLLNSKRDAISEALRGSPVTTEAFATAIRSAIAGNEKLADCVDQNPESVLMCVMKAAQLGLRPGDVHGHFYLIPRKLKSGLTCTSIVGYRGYIDLVMRTGKLLHVDAVCVYRGEEFAYDRATGEVRHPFALEDDVDRSDKNLIAAYAIAQIEGRARPATLVLRRKEIEARRARSQASGDGPWVTDFAAMCRKTALRALLTSGLVPLGDMAERIRGAEDDEVVVPTEHEVVVSGAPPRPSVATLTTAALEADPLPPDRAESIARLKDMVEEGACSRDELVAASRSMFGQEVDLLPAPLLAQLVRAVEAGDVGAPI